jgi:hypothetical protein
MHGINIKLYSDVFSKNYIHIIMEALLLLVLYIVVRIAMHSVCRSSLLLFWHRCTKRPTVIVYVAGYCYYVGIDV